MRWVAIGLSNRAVMPRAVRLRDAAFSAAASRGGQRRDGNSMEPAGGDPGTMKRASRGDEPWPSPAQVRFVCLGLDGRPVRTAGNEGVPLQ